MKTFENEEEGGLLRQDKRGGRDNRNGRTVRVQVETPDEVFDRWENDPPIVQAREMIGDARLLPDLEAELIEQVSTMSSEDLSELIDSGDLQDKIDKYFS